MSRMALKYTFLLNDRSAYIVEISCFPNRNSAIVRCRSKQRLVRRPRNAYYGKRVCPDFVLRFGTAMPYPDGAVARTCSQRIQHPRPSQTIDPAVLSHRCCNYVTIQRIGYEHAPILRSRSQLTAIPRPHNLRHFGTVRRVGPSRLVLPRSATKHKFVDPNGTIAESCRKFGTTRRPRYRIDPAVTIPNRVHDTSTRHIPDPDRMIVGWTRKHCSIR